ncbi:MAG: TonB-dependent receptor [Bacteroidales bacterium]|nr:TonB-dependent receptor [Bacteroidales bacterium]
MKKIILFFSFIIITLTLSAQPGGPGGPPPGGFPGGGFPGGPRGPRGAKQMQQTQQKSTTVKQKKNVKAGSTFKVVGSLIDSTKNEPLMYCNVTLLEKEDSSFVKGAVTDINGYFEVKEVPAGEYLLRVSYIGYATRYIPVTVTNNTAIGVINMKAGAAQLKAVKITAARPLYAMDGEKTVYNVADDPSIQTGTTEDALQNAPGVEVDVEGNITLRGVSSVEIWVNDKPSKLTEENLKTYLQTLPANALDRIETITNPSAKYATEAEAIINIITSAHVKSNKFVSFGLNGSNQPFVSPWVSYMWAKERLSFNLFASGRYSFRDNESDSWSLPRTFDTTNCTYDTIMYQTDTSTSGNRSISGNIFMSLDYEIDSMTDLSVDGGGFYNYNRSFSNRNVAQTYWPLALDSNIVYGITDTTTSPSYFTHIGADYTKKFDLEGHNLRIGINGRLNHNGNEEYYRRNYTTFTDLDENRYLLTDSYSGGVDLDARYNRPYSKNGELSYGLRFSNQYTNNDYKRYNDLLGSVPDNLRTYHFDGRETSTNVDVNWTRRWGGFTLSTGLGVGHENFFYGYSSTQTFADSNTVNDFTFRPSIHLTYRTASMHNFKLNYSMRMSNPSEEQITSFRIYGEDSYRTGNPNGLKSAFTHSAEAGWTKYFQTFGNVGIEGYGRLSTNEISSLTDAEYDNYLDRIVNYSIPYNMGTSWRYGASLNMTYRPSGFMNVRLYANVYDYGYRMEYLRNGVQQTDERDKVSWSIRLNAWTKIFNQYQLHMSFNYSSPTISLMSTQKERLWFNMGVRSDFFKRKLSVFVNIQDLFNWGARRGSGSENTNPYYLSNSSNRMINSRYISAGITLRFGKMELERNAQEGSSDTGDTLE